MRFVIHMGKARVVAARSVSRGVWERLQRGPVDARVLAVFDRACDLLASDGAVFGLVLPEVGNGPLNVVVEGRPGLFSGIEPGEEARLSLWEVSAGGLRVDLRRATVWEPRPDWESLRARWAEVEARLPGLRAFCLAHGPEGSLLAVAAGDEGGAGRERAVHAAVGRALGALRRGWEGDPEGLREGASALAGLGGGLTPAGDDFLLGVMARAWLAHPVPAPFCRVLAEVAGGRTTALSAALLWAAARGMYAAPWHQLLSALVHSPDAEVQAAAQAILAYGATSGADGLAGFLAMDRRD